MKRGEKMMNQEVEEGTKYPSIFSTNKTEKTVKLYQKDYRFFIFTILIQINFSFLRDLSNCKKKIVLPIKIHYKMGTLEKFINSLSLQAISKFQKWSHQAI